MRVRAYAKINLSLRVLGTRSDGYHELRTIFQSIALHDELTIRESPGPFRLTCDDPKCPADYTNLIWRAADRMWRAARRRGTPRDVAIDLRKRIPMNAGLGGGSSDAAAAIRVFARMWSVGDDRARAVGREIGADVPYFFEGGTVLGLERGDLLFPLIDREPASVVLAIPRFGVSTQEAFAWWDEDARAGSRPTTPRPPGGVAAMTTRSVSRPSGRHASMMAELLLANDLEPSVSRRHRNISQIVRRLRAAGAVHAAMSGSGSAVFGLFKSERAAARAARTLSAAPQLTSLVTRTLSRVQYRRLAGV
jgi:4-diphosphocytidyl-2-C-methyl-D-erythritol kinase